MTQLLSDAIYRDLKQKGLDLTVGTKVIVPNPSSMKVGFVKKLGNLISRKNQQKFNHSMIVFQIFNSAFIVAKKHAIFIYRYVYDESQRTINVENVGEVFLRYEVEAIYTCQVNYIQDRDFPLLFKAKDGVGYFNFDLKEFTLTESNFIRLSNVIGVGFISDKQCLLIDDRNIHHYAIQQTVVKQKSVNQINLQIGESEYIKRTWVLGHIDEQQDSTITIFYATIPKQECQDTNHPPMRLKIKQLTRTLDGDLMISAKCDFAVETKNLQYRDKFNIISVGDYYCLQLNSQVLVLRKKFDKYMLLDNMVEIMNGYQIKLSKKGLVASIGEKLLQLSSIQFSDPKCSLKILDVIEFPPQLAGYNKYFRQLWPILNPKQYTLIFVFVKESQIVLSGLIKLEPMQKMVGLAKNNPKQKLEIIQDMALNLGIAKKDFYLKLWAASKKENIHIYQYLIPCKNVNSIKKQLKSTLRTRTIQVSEMLKILEKVTQINLENLKKDLNEKNLKQFVKNDFLRRKIKLNEMDKMLDHRIFENIYSSSLLGIFFDIVGEQLDPVQPKFDPLHSSINFQPYKELKSLENVFQQFKVIILEDYKTFLRQFLSKFPKKITQVLTLFSFLLPNYPFDIQVQKPSKMNEPILKDPNIHGTVQQLWFQTVTVSEWQAEVTKQRILRQLFNDYPTSKITQTIDEFYNSTEAKQNKRWKHGLITVSLDEFTKKLKSLNGLQLYLNVCEFANEMSIEHDGDPLISMKILNILRDKNNLGQPDMHYCRLYASMHYFMLKNKIMSKNKLEIATLTNLKPENLIAIFLLQNKQRKQLIFGEFKNLYQNKHEFREVLQKFVQSENCSRIQLQILIEQIREKGQQFQQDNQDLIELLITGICMKVEIRQCLLILDADDSSDENEVGCVIDSIRLSKNLALKVNRVKQLKKCKSIFHCFQLQRMTYKELLDLEKDNQIFKLVLSKYFQLREDDDQQRQLFEVQIEEELFNLDNPRNLLTVLIYLQQTVYYSAKPFEVFLTFGLQLILWKEFEVMRDLVNDENALETLGIDRNDFLQTLIIKALQFIYLDPEIVYDDETKQQIINILSIDDEKSPLKDREIAKLDLVDIFTQWNLEVHPSDIHTVCQKWKNNSREEFMVDLIDNYVDNLDFKSFELIYKLLQVTDKQTTDINHLNKQYVKFCDFYAKKLLQKKRYKQVIDIIIFLMSIPEQKIEYAMLVESYIQTIVELFSDDLEKGRIFLQFFVQKYDSPEEYSIKELLQAYFDEALLKMWDRSSTIVINYRYHYSQNNKMQCEVHLDDLWQMSKNQAQNSSQLFYNYFFLTMGLSNPKKGLSETVGISYNLQKITNLLTGELQSLFEKDENLWFVNYSVLLAKFLLEGMLGQAANSLNLNINFSKDRREIIELILKELRARRFENEKNDKILNIITKLKAEVFNKNKRKIKEDKYNRKLKQINDKEIESLKEEEENHIQSLVEEESSRPQVFLTWKMVSEEKKVISSNSQYIMSEKDLIDQVFESNIGNSDRDSHPNTSSNRRPNTFENLFQPIRGLDKVGSVIELLKGGKYQQVMYYTHNLVIEAIEKMFSDPERDYMEIVNILDALDFGDPNKRALFKLTKYYIAPLPNQIRRQLFTLNFLLTPIQYGQHNEKDKYALIYEELQPKIKEIVQKISASQLKELATFMSMIFQSSEYAAKVYLQTLLLIGCQGVFDSNTVLIMQQCIEGLADFPEIISLHYQDILSLKTNDKQMKPFIRESLLKLMTQKHYDDVVENIKSFKSQQ